jgi:hypothetical protein
MEGEHVFALHGIHRASRTLRLLVPRRRLAARGARGPGGRAWLRGAGAHRPRRGLRVARVRARREGVRRPADHRGGGHFGRRFARHTAGREPARVLEPLPAPDGGSLRDSA